MPTSVWAVVEDVWTTPGVGMQLGGGDSSLTLHPLSSRSAAQTAGPEILFFSPKIRSLFWVAVRPHEWDWTVHPNVVIKTYLFCACYLPVTQCDEWSVLAQQTSGGGAESFFFPALMWGSALCCNGTLCHPASRSRPTAVCLCALLSAVQYDRVVAEKAWSFSLPVPLKVSANTKTTSWNLDTDQQALINRIPPKVCCHEIINCAVSSDGESSIKK